MEGDEAEGKEPKETSPFTAKFKGPTTESNVKLLKDMCMFLTKKDYEGAEMNFTANTTQHPCPRYCADRMIESCLNNLPKRGVVDVYDMGAKYAAMRKSIRLWNPEIIYHGVRSR